jgi:hypothetical protein
LTAPVGVIPAFAANAVAIILGLAGAAKLITRSLPVEALSAFGLPHSAARLLAFFAPFAEIAVAGWFLSTGSSAAACAQLALCTGLALVASVVRIKEPGVKCHCFGVIDGRFEGTVNTSLVRAYTCFALAAIGIAPASVEPNSALAGGAVIAFGLLATFGLLDRSVSVVNYAPHSTRKGTAG